MSKPNTIDYKVKTELPYDPPEAMLVLAGRGQVVRLRKEIILLAVSLLFTCFTHTHFRVFLIHMDFSILYHNFI